MSMTLPARFPKNSSVSGNKAALVVVESSSQMQPLRPDKFLRHHAPGRQAVEAVPLARPIVDQGLQLVEIIVRLQLDAIITRGHQSNGILIEGFRLL